MTGGIDGEKDLRDGKMIGGVDGERDLCEGKTIGELDGEKDLREGKMTVGVEGGNRSLKMNRESLELQGLQDRTCLTLRNHGYKKLPLLSENKLELFAPNSQYRAWVTPARRGRGHQAKASRREDATPVASHTAMSWAQRLKRAFDIETCSVCGGSMKVIACIEDPVVIKKVLTHLRNKGLYLEAAGLPPSRAPPQADLFS